METAALFVDVNNMFYGIKKRFPGKKLNYEAYAKKIREKYDLYRCIAYGSIIDENTVKFMTLLRFQGFDPYFKRAKITNDDNKGRIIQKYNWDITLSMEVVRVVSRVNTIIIGSMDHKLIPLLYWIKEQGAKSHVYAPSIGNKMKKACDLYTLIDETLLEGK